jgi:hypothetical protein
MNQHSGETLATQKEKPAQKGSNTAIITAIFCQHTQIYITEHSASE